MLQKNYYSLTVSNWNKILSKVLIHQSIDKAKHMNISNIVYLESLWINFKLGLP